MKKVNRDLFEPSYLQLVLILQEQMASGELRPGDKLPSESQLCKFHDVSPMTVRRAINILVDQGAVSAEQGRGTFVKSFKFWSSTFDMGELNHILLDDKRTHVKILQSSIITADERIARKMKIKAGEYVIYIRRLINLDEKPFLYHREYLIYDESKPIIESELDVTSIRCLFEGKSNSSLKYSLMAIEATVLDEKEAALLNSTPAKAAFLIEHTFLDFDDRIASWGWFICPGDKLRFTNTLGPNSKEHR
jgi:DNA-binding GntR family transcriptional regulator